MPRRLSLLLAALFTILSPLAWSSTKPEPSQHVSWPTFGHDSQRSGWARHERRLAPSSVANLHLDWETTVPNAPHSVFGLTAAVVSGPVATPQGKTALVIVAGSSNHLFALSASNGSLVWQRSFPIKAQPLRPVFWLCPNAMMATPVIDAARHRVFALAADGRLYTIDLATGRDLKPPFRFAPPFSKMWSLNYVPATGHSGHGYLYTTQSQDCNDARSGVLAVDPDQPGHPVTFVATTPECGGGFCGGGVWGRGGAATLPGGDIIVASGDGHIDPAGYDLGSSVIHYRGGSLTLADYFNAPNAAYLNKMDLDLGGNTPTLFPWHNRWLAAVGGKESVVYLLDTKHLGGATHHRSLYTSPRLGNDAQSFQKAGIWGGMSSWSDAQGRRWLYVPLWGPEAAHGPRFPRTHGAAADGSVMAFQVVPNAHGEPVLQPAWRSTNISVPEPVAIANGVVFALGTGENTTQVINNDISRAIHNRAGQNTGRAVLYALDARTGRTLWDSRGEIHDWTHFSGLALAAGQVFVTTNHGQVYAFGLGVQHGRHNLAGPSQNRASTPAQRAVPPSTTGEARSEARLTPKGCAPALALFEQQCALCHGENRRGNPAIGTPDFTNTQWQKQHADAELKDAIRNGQQSQGRMPAFGQSLSAAQIDSLVHCAVRQP